MPTAPQCSSPCYLPVLLTVLLHALLHALCYVCYLSVLLTVSPCEWERSVKMQKHSYDRRTMEQKVSPAVDLIQRLSGGVRTAAAS